MAADSESPIILFDGVCNLCERSVQFVIRNDGYSRFRFASLQSSAAARILREYDYKHDGLSSVLLVENDRIYRKSRAALKILRQLKAPWPILHYLFFWVPTAIADPLYDFIGNRRYRWFGKKRSCWIPDQELQRRFLDEGVEAADQPPGP